MINKVVCIGRFTIYVILIYMVPGKKNQNQTYLHIYRNKLNEGLFSGELLSRYILVYDSINTQLIKKIKKVSTFQKNQFLKYFFFFFNTLPIIDSISTESIDILCTAFQAQILSRIGMLENKTNVVV